MGHIRDDKYFEIIDLYFSCTKRNISDEDDQYYKMVERIGRHPNIIYPYGTYCFDVDLKDVGMGCCHFGEWEFKYCNKLTIPFNWDKQRDYIKKTLLDADMHIEKETLHSTVEGVKDVYNPYINYPLTDFYDKYCKELSKIQIKMDEKGYNFGGKGFYWFLFYTKDLKYFGLINFSGSEYIFDQKFKKGKYSCDPYTLNDYLGAIAEEVEPCFDEALLFLMRMYGRHNFQGIFQHVLKGEDMPVDPDLSIEKGDDSSIWFDSEIDWLKKYKEDIAEEELISSLKYWEDLKPTDKRVVKWLGVREAMREVCINVHGDTIVETPKLHHDFAESVRKGKLYESLRDKMLNKIEDELNDKFGNKPKNIAV